MGIKSGLKKTGKTLFNFDVKSWYKGGYTEGTNSFLRETFQEVFSEENAEHKEKFADAMQRLELTEEDLELRVIEFKRLFAFYLLLAALIFIYSLYLVITRGNIGGFFMGFGVTLVSLANAFRYHFWLFQIKERKLGCSLRDWLNSN